MIRQREVQVIGGNTRGRDAATVGEQDLPSGAQRKVHLAKSTAFNPRNLQVLPARRMIPGFDGICYHGSAGMRAGKDFGFTAMGVFPHDASLLASDLHDIRCCSCASSSLLFALPTATIVAASFPENKIIE